MAASDDDVWTKFLTSVFAAAVARRLQFIITTEEMNLSGQSGLPKTVATCITAETLDGSNDVWSAYISRGLHLSLGMLFTFDGLFKSPLLGRILDENHFRSVGAIFPIE